WHSARQCSPIRFCAWSNIVRRHGRCWICTTSAHILPGSARDERRISALNPETRPGAKPMSLEPVQQTFLAESRDLLRSMEQALLHLESCPGDSDAINVVFGAAHTIKGSAGVVGFDSIVDFAHLVESVLDKVRNGTIAVDAELIALLLS